MMLNETGNASLKPTQRNKWQQTIPYNVGTSYIKRYIDISWIKYINWIKDILQLSNLSRDEAIGNYAGPQCVQTTPLYNTEKRLSLLFDHQPGRCVSSERKT